MKERKDLEDFVFGGVKTVPSRKVVSRIIVRIALEARLTVGTGSEKRGDPEKLILSIKSRRDVL